VAKKRAAGEGTYCQRKDGRWMGQICLGHDVKGKIVRKTVYGHTLKEARDKIDGIRKQHESGLTNEKVGTVGEFLDLWIADDVKVSRDGNKTIQEYADVCKRYIKPYIGHIKLQKLTSMHCRTWQGQLSREDFTANMRKKSLRVFSVAMTAALLNDLITRNPLIGVPKPSVKRRKIHPLEPEQCTALFSECHKHRLGDVIILAAMTGLRKGELFALHWDDVNIAERVITVRKGLEEVGGKTRLKEPKTKAGRRAVLLDAIAADAFAARVVKAKTEGLWKDSCAIVFSNNRGGYLLGSNFDRNVWYPIRKRAGISETVRFHDLRHTQASLMLAAGVHPKVVQERLGHSDISLTLNTYSHLLAGMQADGVEKMADLLGRRGESVEPAALPVEEKSETE
jgi:integrase